MSKLVKGVVFRVYEKTFRGRPSNTIKIDNDPIYYRAGEERYAGIAESGNVVEFEAEMNPGGTDARIVGGVRLVKPESPATAGTPSVGFNSPERQNSIVYQSSRGNALEFLSLALANEAVKLPTKQADRLGTLEALLDRYTAQFFTDVGTLGAVVREAESEEKPEPVPTDDE